jgi:hypothetical protein
MSAKEKEFQDWTRLGPVSIDPVNTRPCYYCICYYTLGRRLIVSLSSLFDWGLLQLEIERAVLFEYNGNQAGGDVVTPTISRDTRLR